MTRAIPHDTLVGKTYGRLTFLEPIRKTNQGWVWRFKCACGNTKEVLQPSVLYGNTRSCGCIQKEQAAKNAKVVHGHNRTGKVSRTYTIWRAMLARCFNKRHEAYGRYGGAGITVDSEWARDFTAFLRDMGEAPDNYSLDRIDNSKGYSKSNCRWASREQQGRNKKTNVLLTYNGKTQCVAVWAREVGIAAGVICYRVQHGWCVEDAITKPAAKKQRRNTA